mmetsp:Transcript_23658/g.64177  ORF Transcript_23658/g.64177 Transcript_23658/m.64177 type:complete len:211 (-) Transcript_23658:501-1133(-)
MPKEATVRTDAESSPTMALACASAEAACAASFFASASASFIFSSSVLRSLSVSSTPATASSCLLSPAPSPDTRAYSRPNAMPRTGTAANATSASCHVPKMNMRHTPTTKVPMLPIKVPVDSAVTAATMVTSRARLADRFAAEFLGSSNHAISCLSMLRKVSPRRRRVRRSDTTPSPHMRPVWKKSAVAATESMMEDQSTDWSRTSSGVGR